jgi:hypothetical protein
MFIKKRNPGMKKTTICIAILVALIVGTLVLPVCGEEPVAVQRITALKAHLREDQAVLRQYEWLETTTISHKGEVKSRKLQHCSYDADGAVRKVPFNPTAPEHKRLKLHAEIEKIAETKNGELTKDMQEAVDLVHQYVPLNPNGIQAVSEEGKLLFSVSDPGKQGQLTIRDFLMQGDFVILDLDLTNNRPLSLKINSFLNTTRVPVFLSVSFGSLYGSATFVREAVYDDKVSGLKISVKNTDFSKIIP